MAKVQMEAPGGALVVAVAAALYGLYQLDKKKGIEGPAGVGSGTPADMRERYRKDLTDRGWVMTTPITGSVPDQIFFRILTDCAGSTARNLAWLQMVKVGLMVGYPIMGG